MMFSCLMAGYYKDNPVQLREALESLCRQSLTAHEIVFVADGRLNSKLYEVLGEFSRMLPIKFIELDENKGLGNALNVGLGLCTNDIILRMDTDDVCHERRFEKQVKFLSENEDVSIVGTWAKDINEEGEVVGERTFPTSHEELYNIIWSCPFAHPTVAFRKKDIERVGSYRTDIKRRQDYELWMRAAKGGLRFANLPEYLLFYRFTDEYYKKNNFNVALQQARIGWEGLKRLKINRFYPYLAVASPLIRAMMPSFLEKKVHNLVRKVDPRRQRTFD